jgi:hypothetical protein
VTRPITFVLFLTFTCPYSDNLVRLSERSLAAHFRVAARSKCAEATSSENMKKPVYLFLALSSLVPTLAAQTVTPAPTSYYRLRFSFNTKSDWASLETSDPRVLIARQISTQNNPQVYTMSTGQVMIGQAASLARAGNTVGVEVDYAISTDNLATSPVTFTIRSGDINNSWAAIWTVNGNSTSFFQLVDTLNMPGSGSWQFTLNSLAQTPPSQVAAWQTPALQKMAWAFYYPWYAYVNEWNNPVFKDKPAQLYSSGDPVAIQQQMQQAKSAGLDGFISSWQGPGAWTDTFLKPVLDTAQTQNFWIAPYLETLDANGNPQSPAVLVQWLTYLLTNYANHPAFYKVGGRPVVFVWATYSLPLSTWGSIFAQVRAKGLDAAFLSMGVDWNDLQVFDGLHMYGYNGPEIAGYFPSLKKQVKYYHLVADTWAPTRAKIWAPGLAPGYDETSLPGRTGRVQPRNNGSYYQSQWDIVNASNPDWVGIISWNEFFENTHIEPSVNYGTQYLQETGANVSRWKRQ